VKVYYGNYQENRRCIVAPPPKVTTHTHQKELHGRCVIEEGERKSIASPSSTLYACLAIISDDGRLVTVGRKMGNILMPLLWIFLDGAAFTQLEDVSDFSAQAKVEALNSWISTVVGKDNAFCIAGASLGGAAAIEVAAANPKCQGLILLDAQGFVDGIGPIVSWMAYVSLLAKGTQRPGLTLSYASSLRISNEKNSYGTTQAKPISNALMAPMLRMDRLNMVLHPRLSKHVP